MYKVYKYATGAEIPEDATFLSTVVEEATEFHPRFVWHYFLVEVEDES